MGMKVLIVGGGGREHAIATCVAKSPKVDKIYCAPGNAGIGQIAECVPIGAMEFDKIVAFAKEQAIDLTIVGMDDPLSADWWMHWRQRACGLSDPVKMQRSWKGARPFPRIS